MGHTLNVDAIKAMGRPKGLPFRIGKIGHVGMYVKDLERSARFYTEIRWSISQFHTRQIRTSRRVEQVPQRLRQRVGKERRLDQREPRIESDARKVVQEWRGVQPRRFQKLAR